MVFTSKKTTKSNKKQKAKQNMVLEKEILFLFPTIPKFQNNVQRQAVITS